MTDDLFDTPDGQPSPEAEVPRDQWGRYVLPGQPLGLAEKRIKTQLGYVNGVSLQRATTFAKMISDNYALNLWGKRMALKGLTLDAGLYAQVATTGLEDREGLNALAEKSAELAGAKTRASIGTALHAFTERIDRGEVPHIPAMWAPEVAAYVKLVHETGLRFEHIERIVAIPELEVAGTFDRIATVTKPLKVQLPTLGLITLEPGTRVILDLKTGRDLSYGWGEICIQLKLYQMAEQMWVMGTRDYEPKPELDPRVGLVIHLPVRESEDQEAKATLHAVNLLVATQAVDLARLVREWRKVRGLAAEVTVATVSGKVAAAVDTLEKADPGAVPAIESIPASTRPPTWEERIDAASSPAELSAIWREAKTKGQWTKALEAQGKAQLVKIKGA